MGFTFEKFQFGQIYIAGKPKPVPRYPTENGDVPRFTFSHVIDIMDEFDDKISWIKPTGMNLLVADRVLSIISWDSLDKNGFANGTEVCIGKRPYFCRLLCVGGAEHELNEWDNILNTTCPLDNLWHWKEMCFWGADTSKNTKANRAIRGYYSARYWDSYIRSTYSLRVGFRPVLEFLPSYVPSIDTPIVLDGQKFALSQLQGSVGNIFYPQISPIKPTHFDGIADGSKVKMYTLLCNGTPVRQDMVALADVYEGAKLLLTDKFYGDEYLIPWTFSNGTAVADKAVLKGVDMATATIVGE